MLGNIDEAKVNLCKMHSFGNVLINKGAFIQGIKTEFWENFECIIERVIEFR